MPTVREMSLRLLRRAQEVGIGMTLLLAHVRDGRALRAQPAQARPAALPPR